MNEQEYRELEGVRSSELTALRKSALHCNTSMSSSPTSSQIFGILVHAVALQPDTWDEQIAVSEFSDFRTKAAKAFKTEAEEVGLTVVTQQQFEAAMKVKQRLFEHREAGPLLRGLVNTERCIQWVDEETGLDCKARLDGDSDTYVVDLKTVKSATSGYFASSVYSYGYHIQQAHYTAAFEAVEETLPDWYWITVENTEPYDVVVFEPSPGMEADGKREHRELLNTYRQCSDLDYWPGISEDIVTLYTPAEYKEMHS